MLRLHRRHTVLVAITELSPPAPLLNAGLCRAHHGGPGRAQYAPVGSCSSAYCKFSGVAESRAHTHAGATSYDTHLQRRDGRHLHSKCDNPGRRRGGLPVTVAPRAKPRVRSETMAPLWLQARLGMNFFACFWAFRSGPGRGPEPLKPRRALEIKLAGAIKVLDRRYVTDQCSSVVSGPLQARPAILIQAQATLISLPSTRNHTEERRIRKQEGTMPILTAPQMPHTMPSEIAWYAATPYFPLARASFLRTASTSARESRIHILSYTS
jgi:hypothetical protein